MPPLVLQRTQKSFFRMKRGNVVKVLREVYLREDIECGSDFCSLCSTHKVLERDAQCYIVVDTNICLHQIDALESPAMRNIVLLAVVLDEVRNQNKATYARLKQLITDSSRSIHFFANESHKGTYIERAPGESMNDRNDRAIRAAVEWYGRHLSAPDAPKVILITHDAANKRLAEERGITALSLRDYVHQYMAGNAEVLDKISNRDDPSSSGKEKYRPHLSKKDITTGIAQGRLKQGKLSTSSYNYREATVRCFNDRYPEVLVSGLLDMNRALDGDVVAVEMLPPGLWKKKGKSRMVARDEEGGADEELAQSGNPDDGAARPTGLTEDQAMARGYLPTAHVVGILRSGRREYCGVVDVPEGSVAGNQRLMFMPQSKRIPRVRISTRQASALKNKRVVVVIDDWREDSLYPDGHYTQILGEVGDKDTEAKVVLIENDIPFYEFPPEVIACLPQDDWAITEDEIARRWDLRDRFVCSVDPPGCKDIDDALHCMELPNGNLEVGVHIADVTHFLKEGTAMDLEAAKRATSVYLVDRRIDMLPKLLTEILCSVRGEEESLTFSVVWEMTKDAEVVATKYAKTVVHSRAALSYEAAWTRIQDKAMHDPVSVGLRHLLHLSKILRQRRIDAGALELASSEMKVKLDVETGETLAVSEYEKFPTCSMIEEFMLLANIYVARKIHEHFPNSAFLRRHPAPAETQFEALQEALQDKGFPALDLSSSKALAQSLDRTVDPEKPFFNVLVRMMSTRCMQQAKYFASGDFNRADFHHYGLASDIYTHFTSPIRRYADDIVHRQLAGCLGLYHLSETLTDKEKLHELADNINYRHTQAQYAGRDSTNLHTGFFFKNKVETTLGYVIYKRENGVAVYTPKFGIEGVVWTKDDKGNPTTDRQFRVFDEVMVQISIVSDDACRNRLVWKLAPDGAVPAPAGKRPASEMEAEAPVSPASPTGGSGKPAKKRQRK
eukprot:EG_transcript_1783